MNTKEMNREQLSALVDGELPSEQVDFALAGMRNKEERKDWDIYHRIGDVLRSDDMAIELSPGFAERFSARLDAEPTVMAPIRTATDLDAKSAVGGKARRWALPSMAAAAAMATVAFFTTPQLMVAFQGSSETAAPLVKTPSGIDSGIVAASAPEGVVLRDPRIDDYLMAHQRISPSVYSTAQFARSANFATDSNK